MGDKEEAMGEGRWAIGEKPYSGSRRVALHRPAVGQAGAVVPDLQHQIVLLAAHVHPDRTGCRVDRDGMPHRVLDQRLEDHRRHARVTAFLRHPDLRAQAIAEAQPFQFEVAVEQSQFVGDRDRRSVAAAQGFAEQLAQQSDRAVGLVGAPLLDQ